MSPLSVACLKHLYQNGDPSQLTRNLIFLPSQPDMSSWEGPRVSITSLPHSQKHNPLHPCAIATRWLGSPSEAPEEEMR